tara:strand:+ start:73 stop:363 length:291 start_codon:yes stop_codon:yes gene_type:complete
MANAVSSLVELNSEINNALIENNFSRILLLDTQRRELIKSLATNPEFTSDEKSLTILKKTAEQNQKLMTDITERMTALTQITSSKIKMLRSYRMNT